LHSQVVGSPGRIEPQKADAEGVGRRPIGAGVVRKAAAGDVRAAEVPIVSRAIIEPLVEIQVIGSDYAWHA
jgi:hypothetical protein